MRRGPEVHRSQDDDVDGHRHDSTVQVPVPVSKYVMDEEEDDDDFV